MAIVDGLAQIVVPSRDLAKSRAFYERHCGAAFLFEMPNVVALNAGGIRLLLARQNGDFAPGDTALLPYFRSDDIDQSHRAAVADGAADQGAPHLIADLGDRQVWIAIVKDPSGHNVGYYQEKPKLSA